MPWSQKSHKKIKVNAWIEISNRYGHLVLYIFWKCVLPGHATSEQAPNLFLNPAPIAIDKTISDLHNIHDTTIFL